MNEKLLLSLLSNSNPNFSIAFFDENSNEIFNVSDIVDEWTNRKNFNGVLITNLKSKKKKYYAYCDKTYYILKKILIIQHTNGDKYDLRNQNKFPKITNSRKYIFSFST